jgi:hypothetical protein
MYATVRSIYRITGGTDGPSAARRAIVDEFGGRVPALVLEKLKLLISEIVTNRVVHGDGADDRMILDLRSDRVLRCAVVDHGPATLPQGCVLGLVDQLADRWGVTRSCEFTQMWFETAVPVA